MSTCIMSKIRCKLNRIEALCESLMQNLLQLPPTGVWRTTESRRWGSFWSFGFIHPNQQTNTRPSSSARTAAPGEPGARSQKKKQIFKSSCKALKSSPQSERWREFFLIVWKKKRWTEKPHSVCNIPCFFVMRAREVVVVIYLYICHWVFW